ncbi:MAG: hypothetical protein SP1CHLAM54_03600 [Chlamydiia bacterium]|nr:hypothetical protein [Chlamydiia bacterium]MCH9615276.1 hypothetical protein [Chlamydiia bacterium]MCH9628402.1 hypothetical protein [Chlamydiia bacterium]
MGTIKGVFIPNILQMIGVILFMRLSWILGQVGLTKMTLIIGISSSLLIITSLSLMATLSNMKMEGGGSYYLISRTLGIEFGSAIGILISISQLVSVGLCISGFSLSLHEFIPHVPIQVIEVGTLTILMAITFLSTELVLKTQLLIFAILAVSITSIFLGGRSYIPESLAPVETLGTGLSFWAAFALFFPATTGIEAGLSMSGDLKKPSRSIQFGTLASVVAAFLLYSSLAYFFWGQVPVNLLKSHPFIVFHLTKYGNLVMLGVWGATLSSAFGSILSGPRIVQAIAGDGMLPRILTKPLFTNLFLYGVLVVLLCTTDINHILPILTMTCLVTYGLINFVAFFEKLIHNPSYRPTFHIAKFIPLVGSIGCFVAMFLINAGAAFLVLALTIALCVWTFSRKVAGNFEDLRYSLCLYFINKGIFALSNLEKNAKSWRPHILTIISGDVLDKNLAFFSHALNQEKGFLTFGLSVNDKVQDNPVPLMVKNDLNLYNIPSYVHINSTSELKHGPIEILANYGLGPLRPNTTIRQFEEKPSLPFATFLLGASNNGKNTIILKSSPETNVFTRKNDHTKQINLWWGGEYRGNFELCLALSHLLQMSDNWQQAKICIKTVVKDQAMREKKTHQFERFNEKLRLQNLSFTAIEDVNEAFFPNLAGASEDADLTFLGLRSPNAEETSGSYQKYLQNHFEQTKSIKNIAYVLSGESLEFEKIFFE